MTQTKIRLRITEIFYSLQGESTLVGLPTVFVRLTGCPLRCHYCDTAYAFSGGKLIDLSQLLAQIHNFQCSYVCVTGGEPLAQPACIILLQQLCDAGFNVSLETSGAINIATVDSRVMVVMDLKTPDSGECHRNLLSNISQLKKTDQIKFVIASRKDYEWACKLIVEQQLNERVQILFSPSWDKLNPTILADWIIADRLAVRLQLQLHKILWNDMRGR